MHPAQSIGRNSPSVSEYGSKRSHGQDKEEQIMFEALAALLGISAPALAEACVAIGSVCIAAQPVVDVIKEAIESEDD